MATVTTASGASWQSVAGDRQRHRAATLAAIQPPPPPPLPSPLPRDVTSVPATALTPAELAITSAAPEALAARLASAHWTAVEVARAFLRRAALAQTLANCVAELLGGRALRRAAELDALLRAEGRPVGALHGVPVSVKEHLAMKGLDLNAGFVSWVGRVAEEDALILQCLWEAGAVFYVRTTQPQTLMHLETANNIYGTTTNPHNTTLTAGGSSGGEGALLGLRGSVLGIGTDIGGSIRSPAANNGVFGLKPTALRLPVTGWAVTMAGAEAILGTIGPLSTSVEGLRMCVKAVLAGEPWRREPALVRMPWREETGENKKKKKEKLKVAVLWHDDVVLPHPPVTCALREVVEKLKASADVDVVDWVPLEHARAWGIISSLYFADGGAEEAAAIDASGEPWLPLSDWILRQNPHVRDHSVASLWRAVAARDEYRTRYAAHWNATSAHPDGGEVDVLLTPAGPGVAPKLETARYWGYTAQWNLLDYPAVVFPVGGKRVGDEGDENMKYPDGYEPRGEADRYNYDLWREHGVEGYKGAPVSLQLVGRRFEDEKLLKALEVVLDAAGLPRHC
ncbi:amidase [Xylariomycetidae sp. FL0641]|nr:amidase [Xylariomycetidae sp. FL0641]